MTVTLKDVAVAAGVSASTVSRAFSAPDQVQERTLERVREAAARLGYVPDPAARSLRSGRTESLGLIIPDIVNPFFPPIVKAMQARARRQGYTLLMADCDKREIDEADAVDAILKKVDGLILWASTLPEDRLRQLAEDVPLVLVNRQVSGVPAVQVSLTAGVTEAAEHLRALGHTRCAFIDCSRSEQSRGKSIGETFHEHGLSVLEFGPYEPRFETGIHAATLVLAHDDITAVVAHNDLVALGVLHQLASEGVDVPRRLSVVGIDDTLLASTAIPALTTIRISPDELAAEATDLLLETVNKRVAARQSVEVGSRLIPRASTGRAPRRP